MDHVMISTLAVVVELSRAGDTLEKQQPELLWLLLRTPHRQRIIDWCDATGGSAAAFDFTTKAVLQEAVASKEYWRLRDSHGRPPGAASSPCGQGTREAGP